MPLDPEEDMYSSYLIEIIDYNDHTLQLRISELHRFGNLPNFEESFLLNEMLDNYLQEIPPTIAVRIFYELHRGTLSGAADDQNFEHFKKNNPSVSKFMNWYGASHGDFFLTDKAHLQMLKNSRFGDPQHKDKHGADIYSYDTREYNNEKTYYYQTYARRDYFFKIAQANIYNLEILDAGKNKETEKEWVILQCFLSEELDFLIPAWKKEKSWKTAQSA
jgi:hypothetical protein